MRKPFFVGDYPAPKFATVLCEECEKRDCDVLIACYMPDHLHAMIRGRSADGDALETFYRFKLRTGVMLDRFDRPTAWQKDFYNHIVRTSGDWRGQAKYICLNPLRAGIVEDAYDYAHLYSSRGETREVLAQIFWD